MMHGFRCLRILVLIAVVPLGGCLFRSRPVALRTSTAPLQTAIRDELAERINAEATKIQTLKAGFFLLTFTSSRFRIVGRSPAFPFF